MGKKNIDKLFQDKLKGFSEVPDEKVWQSIEASLDDKKKSRKVIPIWWKLGGVAAVFLVAIAIINPFKDNSSNIPSVTNVDVLKTSKDDNKNEIVEDSTSNKDEIVDVQKDVIPIKEKDASIEQIVNSNVVSRKDTESIIVQKSSNLKQFLNQKTSKARIASSDKAKVEKPNENGKNNSEKNYNKLNLETEIVKSSSPNSVLEKNLPDSEKETKDFILPNEIVRPVEEVIAENVDSKKKSIFEEIEKKKEEEVVAENTGNKWSAGPSIAPVYYSAMGEGSPVHSIFVPNSKTGDVNLSYGLTVAYELNKKLSLRSGIHKVDFRYRTNDIEFSSSLESARSGQIDNINYISTSTNLVVNSKAVSKAETFSQNSSQDIVPEISTVNTTRDGIMAQQFGYIEVPIELNYILIDKKFGFNLIGGISSLFLVDNSISLSSGDLTTDVGEANNVNMLNFSTNVGFGLNYKITPKLKLNVEPVFKYQLNTFTQTDGTFNPFSLGVYSGLSLKF